MSIASRLFWQWRMAILALLTPLLLSGCFGPTLYQVHQLSGGYRESPVSQNRWYVEFYGNGYTSRDSVMAYWLYRCAELTLQKGFEYFVLVSRTLPGGAHVETEIRLAAGDDGNGVETFPVKGRSRGYSAPIYAPGGTITTWSARGVIEMVNSDSENDARDAHSARDLIAKLGPAIRDATQYGTNVSLPPNLLARDEDGGRDEDRARSRNIRLDDLKDLLPKE